jgi:hypothetical protein
MYHIILYSRVYSSNNVIFIFVVFALATQKTPYKRVKCIQFGCAKYIVKVTAATAVLVNYT